MKVEVTLEITQRICAIFEVTEEECESMRNGDLPDRIHDELEDNIDVGIREHDFYVCDENGKVIADWM